MKAKDIIKSRRITNEDGSGIAAAGKRLVGKKLVPAIGFTDAALRAHEGDYVGAGIGTVAGALGLVPPIGPGVAAQAGSISLDALNQLRDVAKERGGWGNLGRDLYQSIKTQEYDPSFLPENLEQLDEAGLRDLIMKYGPEAGTWLKNLVTRKKPGTPEWTPGPKLDTTPTPPSKTPDVTPPPVTSTKPKIERRPGETPRQAVDRAAAEKAAAEKAAAEKAAAEKAAAEKAAAEKPAADAAATPKGTTSLDKKWWESRKKWLDRVEREGGPDAVAKLQKRLELEKALKDAEAGTITGAAKDILKTAGVGTLKGAGLGAGIVGTVKYGPDVIDWALDKGINAIQDTDTSTARPLPLGDGPYGDNKKPAPAPADNTPADSAPAPRPSPAPTDSAPAPRPAPRPEIVDDPNEPRPGRKEFGDQSRAPEQDKEQELTEKYLDYKAQLSEQQKLDLDNLRTNPNVRIMLDLISRAEGNTNYDTLVGGGKFDDFSSHPNKTVYLKSLKKVIASDAAGRYQIMGANWGPYSKRLGLKDFSPESQDKIAIQMLADRGALDSVLKGNFKSAVKKSGSQWTSLPATEVIQGRGPKDWKWVDTQVADLKKVYGINDTINGTQVARADKAAPNATTVQVAKSESRPGYYAIGDSQAQGVAGYGGNQWDKSMAYRGASILDPKQFKIHLANIDKIPKGSVVAISGGGNDVASAKPEVITNQINKLIAAAKARGLQVVHLLPTATDNPKTKQLRDQLRQTMSQGQTLAPIVDLGAASAKDPMNLHLDPKGYKTVAQQITDMLPIGGAVAAEVPTKQNKTEKSVTANAAAEKSQAEKSQAVQSAPANPKLVPIDKRIAGRMENLDSVFRQRLEKALANYPGELRVTSANRLPHEQNKLYQAFINGLSKIPASRELASHAGYAIDVDRNDLAKFHKWLQAEKKAGRDYELETGLEWGGKDRDVVHLQARNWQQIQQQQVLAKKEQRRLDKEA